MINSKIEIDKVVDKWYFDWETSLVDWDNETTFFDFAKEDLKGRLLSAMEKQ